MKHTKKLFGAIALVALMSAAVVIPVNAVGSNNTTPGDMQVTYKANSGSATTPDADWLITYPKSIDIGAANNTAAMGINLDFVLLNKSDSSPYSGVNTVKVTVGDYPTDGIDLTGGTTGTAKLGIADSANKDITTPDYLLASLTAKTPDHTENASTGKAYLKSQSADISGTFKAKVTFTFTDDAATKTPVPH